MLLRDMDRMKMKDRGREKDIRRHEILLEKW